MKHSFLISSLLSAVLMFSSNFAWGWGERGHDVITRVAVQNLRYLSDDDPQLVIPFTARDHMLAHLSNAPDIVWRAAYMSQLERDLNYSTHYIGLEKVYQGVTSWTDFPRDFSQYRKDSQAKGHEPEVVGTAPWRVLQLYKKMVEALKLVGAATDKKIFEDRVNQVLLYAGIMSHFVGDLSNPHHVSENYDGQLTGQRGLHAYFENQIVSELSFDLIRKVSLKTRRRWLQSYSKSEREDILSSPQKLVWALAANSHSKLGVLMGLDTKYSLLAESVGEKKRAERKPAKMMTKRYKKFVVERLAVGASTLSQLWLLAWQEAGSPDLSNYQSYHYYIKPDFIKPAY